MAMYISVPRDLTRVKTKVFFNLTKRQIICFGIGAAIGLPVFFLVKSIAVNINPITGCKTGTLEEYLPGVEKYLAEKAKRMERKPSVRLQLELKKQQVETVKEMKNWEKDKYFYEGRD